MGNIVQRLREAFDVGDWETARTEQTLARKIMLISHKYGNLYLTNITVAMLVSQLSYVNTHNTLNENECHREIVSL